jgi:hypothetical protein
VVKATPRPLFAREWSGTHYRWALAPGLDECGKTPPPGFDLLPVHPAASRYPGSLSNYLFAFTLYFVTSHSSLNPLKETTAGNRNRSSAEISSEGLNYRSCTVSILHPDTLVATQPPRQLLTEVAKHITVPGLERLQRETQHFSLSVDWVYNEWNFTSTRFCAHCFYTLSNGQVLLSEKNVYSTIYIYHTSKFFGVRRPESLRGDEI